jgi:acetyl/propionyl-CoA carboxylase alpha subunit
VQAKTWLERIPEDPTLDVLHTTEIEKPAAPGVRYDFGYDEGDEVAMHYDPLIGKVILYGGSRYNMPEWFLDGIVIEGIKTNLQRLRMIRDSKSFRSGEYDTGLLGQ